MQSNHYTSFESINRELEILALEKEISYQKILISYQKLHENVQPDNLKREVVGYIKEKIGQSFRELFIYAIPYVLDFLKRKRGN